MLVPVAIAAPAVGPFGHVEAIQTQFSGVDFLQVDIDGFTVVSANLDGQFLIAAQHFHAVEIGLLGDTVDFRHALSDFVLDGFQVAGRVGTVLRLYGQTTDVLQVVVNFVQCTFSGLRQEIPSLALREA